MEALATLVVVLVDMPGSALAATSWGIYTVVYRDFPIYCNVRTTSLVVLLSTLGTHSRDDSLNIHCTTPCLVLGIGAHFHVCLDELRFSIGGSVSRLLSLQAHLCSYPWLPWITPWRPWTNSHQDPWIPRLRVQMY